MTMTREELHTLSIRKLSRLIKNQFLSPCDLTQYFLNRIKEYDPQLHAFRSFFPKASMDQAKKAEKLINSGTYLGPLHGIPFAVKDLFDVHGRPTTAGTSLLNNNIPEKDAAVVKRLIEAGMILLGKTHTVQFAFSGIGINHDQGTPVNPWKKEHYIPGGSSSGSAVAVSAGMTPAALGTDTGGSVRVPAALCGVTGLKTTVGSVSRQGVYPLSYSMDSVGPLTRSVEDAALIYQTIKGPDDEEPTTYGLSSWEDLNGLEEGIKGYNLIFSQSPFWVDLHQDIESSVKNTFDIFENLGASVSEMDFPEAELAQKLNSDGLIIAAEAFSVNETLLTNHFDDLDPAVAHRMIKGGDIKAFEYIKNKITWRTLQKKTIKRLEGVDAVIAPTTMIPAMELSYLDADNHVYSEKNVMYLRNTAIGNILNLCAVTVPCGTTSDGLPIGLMIYGKPFEEEKVLKIGYAFQKATSWHKVKSPHF